jgi:hypothetical protein
LDANFLPIEIAKNGSEDIKQGSKHNTDDSGKP